MIGGLVSGGLGLVGGRLVGGMVSGGLGLDCGGLGLVCGMVCGMIGRLVSVDRIVIRRFR